MTAHACQIAHVRIGDTITRPDGSGARVIDAQHYRTAAGLTADVRMTDGRRYNGAPLTTAVRVIPGADHSAH